MARSIQTQQALGLALALLFAGCTPTQGTPQPQLAPALTPMPSIALSPSPSTSPSPYIHYSPTRTPPSPIALLPIDSSTADKIQLLFAVDVPRDTLAYEYSPAFTEVSPDGRIVAFAPAYGSLRSIALPWSSGDSIVPAIDLTSATNFGHRPRSLAFSPDGSTLALVDLDNIVHITELEGRREIATIRPPEWASSVAFTENGRMLAVGITNGYEGSLQLWDIEAQALDREVTHNPPSGGICSLAVSPDGSILAAGHCTYIFDISTWTIQTGYSPLARLAGLDEVPYCPHSCGGVDNRNILAFSPSGSLLASGTTEYRIPMQDPSSGRLRSVVTTTRHDDFGNSIIPTPVSALAFGHDATILAIAADNELQVRESDTDRLLWHDEKPPGEKVLALAISPDGRLLVTIDSSGNLQFWGAPASAANG